MYRLIGALCLCLLTGTVSSDGNSRQAQQRGQNTTDVQALTQAQVPWLDAVRAQRKFREERRRANKAAVDARRRWLDPWGAARKDAWEEESRRRREAMKDEIERNRESLRKRSDWMYPMDPPHQGPPPPTPGVGPDEAKQTLPNPMRSPTGWNNRWFYRSH